MLKVIHTTLPFIMFAYFCCVFSVQPDVCESSLNQLKQIYDHVKDLEECEDRSTLPALLLEGFEDEAVWEQLELQNNVTIATTSKFRHNVNDMLSEPVKGDDSGVFSKGSEGSDDEEEEEVNEDEPEDEDYGSSDDNDMENILNGADNADEGSDEDDVKEEENPLFEADSDGDESEDEIMLKKALNSAIESNNKEMEFDDDEDEPEDDINDSDDNEEDEDASDDDDSDDFEDVSSSKSKSQSKKRTSVVDDKFFNLSDMNEFLENEDKKEEKKSRDMKNEDGESSDEEEDGFGAGLDVWEEDDEEEEEGVSGEKFNFICLYVNPKR